MFVLLILLLIATAVFAFAIIAYRFELKRIAGFMESRPAASNLRLSKGAPLPGTGDLIDAVNNQIDRSSDRELAMKQEESDLLEGLANLSHDIRTPMSGAKGYVQLAATESDAIERARLMGLAQDRLDAMRTMLDQLFDYTRTFGARDASGDEDIDVCSVLSSVLVGQYPAFREAGWDPQVDLQDVLIAHGGLEALRRVFENIVSNILAHGAGDVRITSSGRELRFANRIDAADGSDAIGALDINLVFKRFYRGDSSRSGVGAGLGLSVVKELCDSMGIKVAADVVAEDASGAMFVLMMAFPD